MKLSKKSLQIQWCLFLSNSYVNLKAAVYELWLEEAVNKGLVDAPDFYENRYAYTRCKWIGPGRGWVDPVKEAQACQIRMEIGLSTLEAECAGQGLDWEEVLEQRAREKERMKELFDER